MDKNKFIEFCRTLEEIQKDFPAFKEINSKYKDETIDLWYEMLLEENITDAEFDSVMERIKYHINFCNCYIIPDSKKEFEKSIKFLDSSKDSLREKIGNAIIYEINIGTYDWFDKNAGTKSYTVFAQFYQFLIAHRENKVISFCPFN